MEGNLIFYLVFAVLAVLLIALIFLKSKMRKRLFLPIFFLVAVVLTAIGFYLNDPILKLIAVFALFWSVFLIIRTITKTIDF